MAPPRRRAHASLSRARYAPSSSCSNAGCVRPSATSGTRCTGTDVAKRVKHQGKLDDDALLAIYDTLAATITPKSDLEYTSAFELLVAVVLSAQATDKSVNLATRRLYAV